MSERADLASRGVNASPRGAGSGDVPGVIAPPPLIYLVGLGAGFVLQALLPAPDIASTVRWTVGGALLLSGIALGRSFFRAFGRAHTPISPYRTPTRLVISGVYRFTRNPGYLGMALAYAGIATLTGCVWVLAPLPVVLILVDRGVIAREERYLERAFGEEYLRYKQRTRRWL